MKANRKKFKFLSWALIVAIAITIIPASAFASEDPAAEAVEAEASIENVDLNTENMVEAEAAETVDTTAEAEAAEDEVIEVTIGTAEVDSVTADYKATYSATNEKALFDYLTGSLGLNKAVACGIMANVYAESAFDPYAVNSTGQCFGLCQWMGSRATALKNYCSSKGLGWQTVAGQAAYLYYELTSNSYFRKIASIINEAPNTSDSAYNVAYYFCKYFCEPNNADSKGRERGNKAIEYWNKYASASTTGVQKLSDGNWYYVVNGKIDTSYTGIAKNAYGWWRIVNGKVDFTCNSVEKNEYGWWKLTNGKVDFSYTGLAKNANGWWRIVNGKVDFNCTSIEKNSAGWWRVVKGKVDFDCDTVEKNSAGWWKLENGKVDFTYNGIGENANGWWYIVNGKVDFSYSGTVTVDGTTYTVTKGKVAK